MTAIARLPDRAVLLVSGADRVEFLQGLVSADMARPAPGRAAWSALLTPQGRYVADFFVLSDGDRLLLDLQAAHRDKLAKLLSRYRLRSKVAIEPSDIPVFAAWDGTPDSQGSVAAPDPRTADAGWRLLGGDPAPNATATDYDAHRLALGLPDGEPDLEPDKTLLLEAGFDELGGVDWQKGCYMGQELTARTKYRGLLKRRLVRVRVDGPLPPPGTPITGDSADAAAEIGTLRSGRGAWALATLRLDAIRAPRLRCADASLVPDPAPWMHAELMLAAP